MVVEQQERWSTIRCQLSFIVVVVVVVFFLFLVVIPTFGRHFGIQFKAVSFVCSACWLHSSRRAVRLAKTRRAAATTKQVASPSPAGKTSDVAPGSGWFWRPDDGGSGGGHGTTATTRLAGVLFGCRLS